MEYSFGIAKACFSGVSASCDSKWHRRSYNNKIRIYVQYKKGMQINNGNTIKIILMAAIIIMWECFVHPWYSCAGWYIELTICNVHVCVFLHVIMVIIIV